MPLAFDLESGRRLPVFSRFEGPITLRVTGDGLAPISRRDLDQLLSRLRSEAGVPIQRVDSSSAANITVHVLKQTELQRLVPQAACFVAPRIGSWAEFRTQRNQSALDWTTITQRTQMAVFLPGDVSPQEIRDCLHEEIAQALGPVNDLYHLSDSIFNDDNFHTILTGFDMMILRVFYDDALKSGMSADQVASRLPGILSRVNPGGNRSGFTSAAVTPTVWVKAIETALAGRRANTVRIGSARGAVQIARTQGWNDNRLGFSLFALGRLALSTDGNLALASFSEAESIFRANPNTALHAAHVAVQGAAYALSAGRPQDAIAITDKNSAITHASQNAALLASFLMIKAQALDNMNQSEQARIVRLDSLGWARYGFGSDLAIRQRLLEIQALSPTPKRNPA